MDPTLTALIVAITSLVANLAILVKVITDKIKLTNDRLATKAERDKDSQELHDQVLKNTMHIGQIRDWRNHVETRLDDGDRQIAEMNKELASISTKMDMALELIKELKELKHDK